MIRRMRTAAGLLATIGVVLASLLALSSPATATSSSTSLRLNGGDTLQVNAWHCGTFVSACSWTTSTKLLGWNPANASNITNQAQIEAHGWGASISLGSSWNISLTTSSKTLIQTRWTNYNAWISDSGGVVKPGWLTTYVSTRAIGSAYSPVFGNPSNLQAYAGAL